MNSSIGSQKTKFLGVFSLIMAIFVAVILAMSPEIEEIHQRAILYVMIPVFAAFVLVSIAIKASRIGTEPSAK